MREKIIANKGTDYTPYMMIVMITTLLVFCTILYKYIQRRLEEEKEKAISPDDPILQTAEQILRKLLDQSIVLLKTQDDQNYNTLVHTLETDPALQPFLSGQLSSVSNPLILAYMKKVSQRIFCSKAPHTPVNRIIYAGAYVDLLTPLQLTMEGQGPFEIFMVDNAPNYQTILDPKENAPKIKAIPPEKEELIRRTLGTQNYFASVEAGNDISSYLKFLLDLIEPTNIQVHSNRLSFNFQGKAYTFTFIQADITNVEDVMRQLEASSSTLSPCVYIQKATMDLEYDAHNNYLERLLTHLNPIYCFLSTQSNNLRFHDDPAANARLGALRFKQQFTGKAVSEREFSRELLPYKFLDNPTPQSLVACRHPTLNFFQFAAMEIDVGRPAFLVTGYHLPTLLRGPGQ